jgi:hypothetical protein
MCYVSLKERISIKSPVEFEYFYFYRSVVYVM